MKRTLSLLLVIVMLLVLCACGKEAGSATVDSSQETSTEETSTGTTDTTQAADVEETTAPTQESATTPSEENSTDPTEKPTENIDSTEATKPVHTHAYSAATCTQAKKCSCGATDGSALGHSYSDATCTDAKKCSRCGATDGSALGHNYSDATCTEAKKCARCGVTDGSAAGHNWNTATCTAPKTCAKCGTTEGEILSHSYQDGKCKTCNRRQLGVGRWGAFSLERNEYIGTDLDVVWIISEQNLIGMSSYIDMETIDPELLQTLQQMNSEIVTYQGKQYIEYGGLGDGIYYEDITEESITVHVFDSIEKFTLKRISDTQIKCVDVVGCEWVNIKAGMIFVYQD